MKTILGSRRGNHLAASVACLVMGVLIAVLAGCGGDTTTGTDPNGTDPDHPFAGGRGTAADPYQIEDWSQMNAVRNYLDKNFIIMNDLDSTTASYEELAGPNANGGKGWEPIGTVATGVDPIPWMHYIPFKGSLEGQGYDIRDLFINRPNESYAGLFGYVRGGVITDVGVVNAAVVGLHNVGGLVGDNDGTVENCYAAGNVTGSGRVGGLVGSNRGIVSNCYAEGSVTGDWEIGGLLGEDRKGNVTNSHYNYDVVKINGQNVITIGALFGEDFEEWLTNDKSLDATERLAQEDGYYVINDAGDLKQLLVLGQDPSLRFRLADDLDLAAEANLYIPYLAGEFDGNGHNISNLSFSFDFVSQVGLFGRLAASGKVTGVCVENVSVSGHRYIGGLIGRASSGTIVSHSYATGSVTGEYYVGGLAGLNSGTVSNAYASVNITGNEYVGGLVGSSWGTVSNCYATGSVTGGDSVGGLIGYNTGNVDTCYADGDVFGYVAVGGLTGRTWYGTVIESYSIGTVTGYRYVGGLVGFNREATVENSYAAGSVTGERAVGGLVGWSLEGTVNNSYSAASVTGGDSVGGLVGLNRYGTVNNSYSEGSVTGDQYVGGLVGANEDSSITNCYSSSGVSGTWDVGGLVGYRLGGHVTDCFWDTQTSGQAGSDGGEGKTTGNMMDFDTFDAALWDIVLIGDYVNETWYIDNGNDYPRLGWQPVSSNDWTLDGLESYARVG